MLKKFSLIIFLFFVVFSCKKKNVTPEETDKSIITTVAGKDSTGFSGDGGLATNAKLREPYGIAVDQQGNLFIADKENNRIRKVDVNGIITTIAGTGTGGYSGDGFAATLAKIWAPRGIAVDQSGIIYFADGSNHVVRKINTSGIISTVAGTGSPGFSGDGGQATSAQLNVPIGVALDAAGNIYIGENGNNRVRKVTPGGVISTIAGDGTQAYGGDGGLAINSKLYSPGGITLDAAGNIYIADSWNQRIRKIDASTNIITSIAGNPTRLDWGDGDLANIAQIANPEFLLVDAEGNIYLSAIGSDAIRKIIKSTGRIYTIAGVNDTSDFRGDGGPATKALMDSPKGLAMDAQGNLYIADTRNNRVRKVRFN